MKKVFYISLLGLFLVAMSGFGQQSRRTLERKRKKLNAEIKRIEKVLSQTNRKKTSALDDLKDFNQKITVRNRLIETIELEKKAVVKEINSNEKKIQKYNKELATLKADYADMVFKSYKSKSQQSKTMFLLSSKSFYQAYKRIKYMEQYKEFRKKQGLEIESKTKLVKQLNDSLSQIKKMKHRLISSNEKEKKEIESDKKEQERLLVKIKKDEKKYKKELTKKIKEEKRVAGRIDKIIRDAIARANRGKKGTKKGKLTLSVAEKKLKAKFEQNKGRLPSPLKGGVITRRFGVQPHPTFKKIKINSTGLHIRGKKGDEARAVFNGKVLVVQLLSKGRKSVFLQHGNYITTYTNLKDVYVEKGQNVKTGDKLGAVFTDKVTGKTSLQFILSENTKKLNPEKWVRVR